MAIMSETNIDKLSILINDILNTTSDTELNSVLSNLSSLLFDEQYALLLEAVPLEKRLAVWSHFDPDVQRIAFIEIKKETLRALQSDPPA